MRKVIKGELILLLVLLVSVTVNISAQTGFDANKHELYTSNRGVESIDDLFDLDIPVVVVKTINNEMPTFEQAEVPPELHGATIKNATKVPGRLLVILRNDTIYDSGEYKEKESGMTIKVRSNTSAFKDEVRKPYKVKLQKKADLLCRGDKKYNDKNWVLLKKEKLLWDVGFAVNRLLQLQWTPTYEYVNLIFNGVYYGVYMLVESVERNQKCRLNVDDTGFVFEYDAYWWNENLYVESPLTSAPMHYTFKYPDSDDISEDQLSYFTDMINTMEQSVDDGTYPDYIDVNSFVTWILAEDILGNRSGTGANVFLTKYDNTDTSKVMMGNLWDFDRIFLRKDNWSGCREVFFWYKLFDNRNKYFADAFLSKWNEVKEWLFDDIISYLDSLKETKEGKALNESLLYEESIWNDQNGTVSENVEIAKEWFITRKEWLNSEISKMESTRINSMKVDSIYSNDIYDIGGRKQIPTNAKHGVYIRNRKKVFIK